ncbi:MAG: phage head closure protein [Hyphomicrobiales bacterium]
MTRIGQLNRRLTLETPVATSDGAGGTVVTWQPVTKLWAQVRSRFGNERQWAEALASEATHVIRIRRTRQLASTMRFTEGKRVFEIRSVIEDGRHWIDCLCREKPLPTPTQSS